MIVRTLALVALIAASPAPSIPPVPASPPSGGDVLFAAADFAGAQAAYQTTLQADPNNAAANLGLARIAIYRNDLDGAQRYASALAAHDPANARAQRLLHFVAERRSEGEAYRVTMTAQRVEIPFERIDPLPIIAARVNGRAMHLMLDTGGEGLDLNTAASEKLGIVTQAAGNGTFAGGLPGAVRSGHVDRLTLGTSSIASIPVSVVPQLPVGIDGVLGTNVLARFLSTFDYPHRRLVLQPRSGSAAFEAAARARGAIATPMIWVPDHFLFARARTGRAPEAWYNIDTGGEGIGVQLTRAELDAAGIVPDSTRSATFEGGGGATRTLPFTANVTLGGRIFRDVPGLFFPDGDQFGIFPFRVAGTLSQELFRRGALTFDFVTMQLVFDV